MGIFDYFLKTAPDANAIQKKKDECTKCSADLAEMEKSVSTGATIGGKSRRNRRNSRKHKRRKSRRRGTA